LIVNIPTPNNNNNNKKKKKKKYLDNVYGTASTTVIVRVNPVQNAEQCEATADPQTKPTDLGRESICKLITTTPNIVYWQWWMQTGATYRPIPQLKSDDSVSRSDTIGSPRSVSVLVLIIRAS